MIHLISFILSYFLNFISQHLIEGSLSLKDKIPKHIKNAAYTQHPLLIIKTFIIDLISQIKIRKDL